MSGFMGSLDSNGGSSSRNSNNNSSTRGWSLGAQERPFTFGPSSGSTTIPPPTQSLSAGFTFGNSGIQTTTDAAEQQEPPALPALPNKPIFSSNQMEFTASLEQWAQDAESVLSEHMRKLEYWKGRQNQSSHDKMEGIDRELDRLHSKIAQLEAQKNSIQQKTDEKISQTETDTEAFVRKCKQEISDTQGVIAALRGQPKANAPLAENRFNDIANPPSSLCCPITLQLMMDPVMIVEDGHTYERSAILEHWRTQETAGIPITSPKTNQRIISKQVAPNVLVRSQCREWQEQHPAWRP